MTRKTVAIFDVHSPEQDDKAVELACKIIQDCQPQRLIIGGDSADFREVSSFDEPTQVKLHLQNSIDQGFKTHNMIVDAAGDETEKYFIVGNHEERWLKYIIKHPVLSSLSSLALEEILRLKQLGFEMIDDEIELVNGKLVILHGRFTSPTAGGAVEKEIKRRKYHQSVMMGHVHRFGLVSGRGMRGSYGGWEIGCLQVLEPHYMRHPDWMQGIAIIHEWGNADSDHFQVESIIFTGKGEDPRRAIWRGKEYEVK